jgi:hypothetical protein
VGNLHQIFSSSTQLAYITEGCTQAAIGCEECKTLASQSVNAHLDPIRERRRELAQHPQRLKEVIQQGAQKASKVAEETMVAVRDAVELLGASSSRLLGLKDSDASRLRVPESIAKAQNDDERWEIRTAGWLERVSSSHSLKKDRPRTFITRRGRKVGVHTASEHQGMWKFQLNDRPLNVLVLLAQDKDRYLHDYVLPPKVVQDHWKQFEREDGNVVILAKRAANGVSLSLAGKELPIQEYEGNYAALE